MYVAAGMATTRHPKLMTVAVRGLITPPTRLTITHFFHGFGTGQPVPVINLGMSLVTGLLVGSATAVLRN
ncbi:hypothetical protein ACFWDI_06605 [Streptomyces sp. NPDC060064]|uniref:hypothetical protein n=1 Tax=Streptomyces sp. NPDC060064 TaxID=3347049 RepID=UPI003675255F